MVDVHLVQRLQTRRMGGSKNGWQGAATPLLPPNRSMGMRPGQNVRFLSAVSASPFQVVSAICYLRRIKRLAKVTV